MKIVAGATNVTAYVYIVGDASHASPGDPVTGLAFGDIETGGSASYARAGAARVDLTLVTQTVTGAHTDGGFVEVDATNMPGVYRLDWPDAAFAVGVDEVILQFVVASANNAVSAPIKVEVTDPINGLFKSHLISSASATVLRVADFSGYANDELIGELVWAFDSSSNEWHPAWVTDFATSTGDVTVIAARGGGSLPFTSESGVDRLWRSGFSMDQLVALSVTGAVGSVAGHTAQTADHTAGIAAISSALTTHDGKLDTAQADLDIITGADGVNLLSATQASIDAIEATGPIFPPTNSALANIQFVMRNTSGVPTAGLTVTVTRSIDGAAFGATTGTVAEVASGAYQFDASAADLNGGIIMFRAAAAGALDTFFHVVTDAAF